MVHRLGKGRDQSQRDPEVCGGDAVKNNIHSNIALGALLVATATMPFSIRLCHWSLLAFVINWIAIGAWREKLRFLSAQRLWWLMPLYFLICLIGVLYTDNSFLAWQQVEKKAGFFLLPIAIASSPPIERKDLRWIVLTFILICFGATLYCIGYSGWASFSNLVPHNFSEETLTEFSRLHPNASPAWMTFSYISLASGIGLHPTYFGLYLVFCLLLILYFFRSDELTLSERNAANLLIPYFFFFIVFLSARITILVGAGVLMSTLAFRQHLPSWGSLKKIMVIAIALAAVILFVNPVSRFRSLQEPFEASLSDFPAHATSSIDVRLSLLRLSTLASNGANPFVGSGTGSAEGRLRTEGAAHGITNVVGSYDPHNQYVYTFLEQGTVGLAVLLATIILPLYASIRRGSHVYAGLLLVFAAVCLTESALERQKGIVLFTFFGSLLLFHETPEVKKHDG
jgi:O-antigen ligase